MNIELKIVIASCFLSLFIILLHKKWYYDNLFGKDMPGFIPRVISVYIMTAISCFCILHSIYLLIKQL
jgi:hypothetical protein